MTDAGFFRGTSADQDNRFADKQKKLLKELNFSPILNTKLNMSKIDLDSLKPWIELKIKEILEKDDEILSDSIYEHLAGKEPDGKTLLVLLTGFVEEDCKASKFMEELWTKLIDTQQNSNGLSPKATAAASPENGISSDTQKTNEQTHTDPPRIDANAITRENADVDKTETAEDGERKSRSRSRTPQPQRSNSKSHSRSKSRSPHHSRSVSRSGSKSVSKSRSRSKSGSRSHSRSRSGSRRQSSSRSRSRSRFSSKSRHSRSRSRSPHYRSNRFRRSRSRSGSYRSPRGRRGYIPRGSYRGGFGYQDRRRGSGPIGPPRGRRMISPPWSRRRSPPPYRRRRSPSRSPRRRSRSPLYRSMRSRSRSPPYGHMAGRRSPRPHGFGGGPPVGGRHMPPHDVHRPVMPPRSPRGPPMDYARGYGDSTALPGHSPGHLMGRSHDLPPVSHGLSSSLPRPSGSGAYSPRSPSIDRKRHKKEKKHRKHKKSKKRHSSSSSPERRKKHKKHKKSKKHKS